MLFEDVVYDGGHLPRQETCCVASIHRKHAVDIVELYRRVNENELLFLILFNRLG